MQIDLHIQAFLSVPAAAAEGVVWHRHFAQPRIPTWRAADLDVAVVSPWTSIGTPVTGLLTSQGYSPLAALHPIPSHGGSRPHMARDVYHTRAYAHLVRLNPAHATHTRREERWVQIVGQTDQERPPRYRPYDPLNSALARIWDTPCVQPHLPGRHRATHRNRGTRTVWNEGMAVPVAVVVGRSGGPAPSQGLTRIQEKVYGSDTANVLGARPEDIVVRPRCATICPAHDENL